MTLLAHACYEVLVESDQANHIADFIEWLRLEHGPDLLKTDGCFEYRLFRLNDCQVRVEYLFQSQDHLDHYLTVDAPRLRGKGAAFFADRSMRITRNQSSLLLSMR